MPLIHIITNKFSSKFYSNVFQFLQEKISHNNIIVHCDFEVALYNSIPDQWNKIPFYFHMTKIINDNKRKILHESKIKNKNITDYHEISKNLSYLLSLIYFFNNRER